MKTLTPADSIPGWQERPWKSRLPKRLLESLMAITLALTTLLLVSHLAWNRSGSNQWELAMDEDGIKVWTLKAPGSSLVKVKAQTRIKSQLAGMVKLLEDLDSCVDAECYDAKVLQTIETPPGRYAAYVRFKYDIPGFPTQDFVLLQEHVQDPRDKRLEINLLAAPSRIPADECCARVTHLHNNWKLKPLDNGELDVEFMQDTDMVGMPYFLVNFALRAGTFEVLKQLPSLMDMEKYRTAKAAGIHEWSSN